MGSCSQVLALPEFLDLDLGYLLQAMAKGSKDPGYLVLGAGGQHRPNRNGLGVQNEERSSLY